MVRKQTRRKKVKWKVQGVPQSQASIMKQRREKRRDSIVHKINKQMHKNFRSIQTSSLFPKGGDHSAKRDLLIYLFMWLQFSCYGFHHWMIFLACLYKSTGRAITVTKASALAPALLKMFKFRVKVFKSLYLLNPWMELVDTLSDVRYWSEVLCCTITTHISDLEVKVTDFEIMS